MQPGEWFMIPLGEQFPAEVHIYTGQVQGRKMVRTITRQQALALWRWHGIKGMYFSYKTTADKWRDVRVCGDIDVWFDGSENSVTTKLLGT